MATYIDGVQQDTKTDNNGNIISQTPTSTPQPNDTTTKPYTAPVPPTTQPSTTTNPATGGYTSQVAGPYDATAPKTANPTGAVTQAGSIYADRVTQGLQGKDPTVTNAQNTEDTNASRRNYSSTNDAQQQAAQSGFAPGSAQYQRILENAQAGANTANQAGQNQVNDYTRQRTNDNMAAAQGLETQTYNRGQTADTTAYNRGQEVLNRATSDATLKFNQGETLKNDANTQALNAKTTLQTPQEQMAFQNLLGTKNPQTGQNYTAAEAMSSIVSGNGSVNSQYQGQSPGALDVKSAQDSATAWVTATQPGLTGQAKQAAITARMQAQDTATQAPVSDAQRASQVADAKNKLATGDLKLNDPNNATALKSLVASGDIKSFGAANAPVAGDATAMAGKTVSIDGNFYTVVKGSTVRTGWTSGNDPRHTDMSQMKDANGNTVYFYNGKLQSAPPKTV